MPDLPLAISLAAAAAIVMPGPADPAQHPIRLEVQQPGAERVQLRVVGSSAVAVGATYRLTVDTGSGNRSSQGGRVSIAPGQQVVLVDLTVSAGSPAQWSAVLEVEGDDGSRYQERKQATD